LFSWNLEDETDGTEQQTAGKSACAA